MPGKETYGVRLDPELKNKFQEIAKKSDFGNNEEFFRYLKELYEMNQISEDVPEIESDFKTLQKITNQINSIFTSMADKMRVSLNDTEMEYQKKVTDLYESLDEKEDELTDLKDNLQKENQKLKEDINQKVELIEELEGKVDNFKAKIDNLKDQLSSKVQLLERIKTENNRLQKEIEDAHNQLENLNDLQDELDKTKQENTLLKDDNNRLQEKVEELKSDHQAEMDNLKDKLENEKKAEILEIKSEYQEKIEEIREEKNDKIESLMNLIDNQES